MAWLDVNVKADAKSDNSLDSSYVFAPSKGIDEKKIIMYLGIAAVVFFAFNLLKKKGR